MRTVPDKTITRVSLQNVSIPARFTRTKTPLHQRVRIGSTICAAGVKDLSVEVNGMKFENPFVTGSGPPGTNYAVMKKAFDEGWGGVVAKTVSLDSDKVKNVTPRYAKMRASGGEVIGWENIELISDRPLEVMLEDFARLKQEYPDKMLIASIMEEYNKDAWIALVKMCEQAGVDAFEINFSCPHGMPERRMGMAMGQDCELLDEVTRWVVDASSIPVWSKMTPNITDIKVPAKVCLNAGSDGIAAINTIESIMGVNLDTLRPDPCVEGYSTRGGYSSSAVKPIALARVASIAQVIAEDFPGTDKSLSGIGGINTGYDAAEFILMGSDTVQVCSGVMMHGYPMVKNMIRDLSEFMNKHGFESLADFKGLSLPYMTTHTELVRMQREAIELKKKAKTGLGNDKDWSGDDFVQQSDSMVAN
jgi:dihydropyrimidine dehydrogenase (NADP+)